MRKRTQARECAIKILYQIDVTKIAPLEAISGFWDTLEENSDSELKDFAGVLVNGVFKNLTTIDAEISHFTKNWQLSRMAIIDRNVLRLATFELLFLDDVPRKVSINEAIELAKKYGDKESGKFVNGILDKIKLDKA